MTQVKLKPYLPATADKIVHKKLRDGIWTMTLYRKGRSLGRYVQAYDWEHEPSCISDLEDWWEKSDKKRK